MRLLLDTHTFLWWTVGINRLPDTAREAIADESNDRLISAASAWEIATKYRIGKLPQGEESSLDMIGTIARQGFEELAVTVADGARAGGLRGPLRDPFDRMLIAQALTHDLVLVSNESLFDWYGVRRLW